jgi:hypothetical protein
MSVTLDAQMFAGAFAFTAGQLHRKINYHYEHTSLIRPTSPPNCNAHTNPGSGDSSAKVLVSK